jgi:cytochrome b subunit of formate dehydrogenase
MCHTGMNAARLRRVSRASIKRGDDAEYALQKIRRFSMTGYYQHYSRLISFFIMRLLCVVFFISGIALRVYGVATIGSFLIILSIVFAIIIYHIIGIAYTGMCVKVSYKRIISGCCTNCGYSLSTGKPVALVNQLTTMRCTECGNISYAII